MVELLTKTGRTRLSFTRTHVYKLELTILIAIFNLCSSSTEYDSRSAVGCHALLARTTQFGCIGLGPA